MESRSYGDHMIRAFRMAFHKTILWHCNAELWELQSHNDMTHGQFLDKEGRDLKEKKAKKNSIYRIAYSSFN